VKTVIVFDTDDGQGMEDAHVIMNHLCRTHIEKRLPRNNNMEIGKIAFIKLLRDYANHVLKNNGDNGLKRAKHYSDKVWTDRKVNSFAKTKSGL
jgi:hypothetical protein